MDRYWLGLCVRAKNDLCFFGDRLTWFLRGWSKLTWFLYAGKIDLTLEWGSNWLGFSGGVEITLIFVWGIECDFVLVLGSKLACFLRGGSKLTWFQCLDGNCGVKIIWVVLHGGIISRKIRTELGFELHDTRKSDPRRVGRSTRVRHVLGNCVWLVAGPARSSRSRKELSLSRSMSCTEHELLAAVVHVVREIQLWFSRPIHPGDETNLSCLAQLAAVEWPQRTRWRPRLYSCLLYTSPSPRD